VPAEILVILDRSGSMQSIRGDVVGGFNAFLEEQQNAPGSAYLTLVQFDDMYEKPLTRVALAEVPKLTYETFVPRGGTALHDACVRALRELRQNIDDNSTPDARPRTVVLIMTDGGENGSRQFGRADTFEEIRIMREREALVLFAGANQDAIAEAAKIGIAPQQSVSFAASGTGVQGVMRASSAVSKSYRGGAQAMSVGYSVSDRAASMGDLRPVTGLGVLAEAVPDVPEEK
jgi:uncharacterized protein YegL